MRSFTTLLSLFTFVMLSASITTESAAGGNDLTLGLENQLNETDQWVIHLAGDLQIEYALAAATTARAAYNTFFAAANEGCLSAASNVENCDDAFTEPLSADIGGSETGVPSPSEAEDRLIKSPSL